MNQQPQMPVNQAPMSQAPMNQTPMGQGQPAAPMWLWITFIIVILIGGGFFGWYYLIGPGKKVAATTTPAATTTDWKTYTNAKYGFTLTLTDDWQKYRYQIVTTKAPAESTIYFSLPTTDAKYAAASEQAPAGYAPVFHINVYPIATWTATTIANETLIEKNTTYAFSWAMEESIPTDITVTKADVTAMLASFKLAAATLTADWKTFTSATYGFSFKYPPTWTIKDNAESGNSSTVDIYSATDQIKDASGVQQPNIIVGYIKDLSAIPAGNTPTASDFQADTANAANVVTVGTVKGYWKNVADAATVFVKKGNAGYYFTLWGAQTYTTASQTIKDIISTFQFTP